MLVILPKIQETHDSSPAMATHSSVFVGTFRSFLARFVASLRTFVRYHFSGDAALSTKCAVRLTSHACI